MHWLNIQLPAQRISYPVSTHTRPANAGTRNPRGLTRPARDSNGYPCIVCHRGDTTRLESFSAQLH